MFFSFLPPVNTLAQQEHVRVTILADGPVGGDQLQAQAEGLAARREAVLSSVHAAGIDAQTVHIFTGAAVNGVTLDIPKSELARLQQAVGSGRVYINRTVHILSEQDNIIQVGAPAVWAMTDPNGLLGQPVKGKGVKIAIIDTGVDYTHPDLGQCLGPNCKVIGGWDFVDKDRDPMDCNGHGTHVAGIAAANGADYRGMAPEANILAYRVLGCNGSGDDSASVAGIDRAVADGASVINLSLGDQGTPDDLMSHAVNNAAAAGVVVVAAAGNSGFNAESNDYIPVYNSVYSPAVAQGAIAVANSEGQFDTYYQTSAKGPVPGYSRISKPEISAPGVDIYSTWLMRDPLHYAFLKGTSMSAPHVTGAAALLRQLHPDWTPEMIRSALISTAKPITYNQDLGGGEPLAIEMGAGRLRADWAARAPLLSLPAEVDFGIVLSQRPSQAVIHLRNVSGGARAVNASTIVHRVMEPHGEQVVLPVEIIPPSVAKLSQPSFSIDTGKNYDLTLTINAAGLPGGYYEGKISLGLDAPGIPEVRIPFTFWVHDNFYYLPVIGRR